MKKNSSSSKANVGKKVAIGAGIATLTAALAGTYFLYGSKNATKNRKQVKSWMLKAKGEVLEQLEKLPEINEENYQKVVKKVSEQYKKLKKLDAGDVMEFVTELSSHWKEMSQKAKKAAPKSAKKKTVSKKK